MRAIALTAALAGCLIQNPAYDPQEGEAAGGSVTGLVAASTGGTGGSAGGSTGGGHTGGEATGAATTGEPGGSTSTGAASGTGSTGADATTAIGCEACTGECVTCEDGQCMPRPEGSGCTMTDEVPCEQRIFGYVSEGCALMKASELKVCDGMGGCRYECEDAPGAVPTEFRCDEPCRPEPDKCIKWKDSAQVAAADVCVTDKPSDACHDRCIAKDPGFITEHRACNKDGKCATTAPATSCGTYKCRQDELACVEECVADFECLFMHQCVMGDCV